MDDPIARPFLSLSGDDDTETAETLRRALRRPGDSEVVVNRKARTHRALARFEERQDSREGAHLVESTRSKMADRVSETEAGPGARQTADVVAERLWWLTQGVESWPFPEGRAARAGYRDAARKILAQTGYDAWHEVCDVCLEILRHPTADERNWMQRCSSPHGWIYAVVKRVIARQAAERRPQRQPRQPAFDDLSRSWNAQELWELTLAHLEQRLTPWNFRSLEGSTAGWGDGGVLRIRFPREARAALDAQNIDALEAAARRAVSAVCAASVDVCFV